MAGRARDAALHEELVKRTNVAFDPDPDDAHIPTTLDYVCYWLESGRLLKTLAEELTEAVGFYVDYSMIQRHLSRRYGLDTTLTNGTDEGVLRALDSARVRASHVLLEDGLSIIDAADASSASAVSKAREQARSRQWLAEKYNAERFGQAKSANVVINLGALHLAAISREPNRVTGSARIVEATSDDTRVLPAKCDE